MTVHDEFFEIHYRIAKHQLKRLEILKNPEPKNLEAKRNDNTNGRRHQAFRRRNGFLDEQISVQREIIKLYDTKYIHSHYKFYLTTKNV